MKRSILLSSTLAMVLLLSARVVAAHGTTEVKYDFPASIDENVPLSCSADSAACGGSFAITDHTNYPYLGKISIRHSDPPSGIFQSCHKVAAKPAGYVLVYGQRVTRRDEPRNLYFYLNRSLCSFNPEDYTWFNNRDYLQGEFGWTATRPALIDPDDIQEMCRNNAGKTVTVVKKLQAYLLYNSGEEEAVGPTRSLTFNFHCAPPPPHLGCFKDDAFRKLPIVLSPSSTMTIAQCVVAARQKRLAYAGVQFGGQCYGGNSLAQSDIAENQEECNMPCNSNKTEICGGVWRNSVYYAFDNANWPPTSLGCYVDDSSRKLPVVLSSSSTMTIQQCLAAARSRGLVFAGLQFGGQCYGGNEVSSNDRAINQGECNMPCSANRSETCGGTWRNSVYYSGYPPTACAKGLTACAGACRNLASDPGNCGACGHFCAGLCQNGSCTPSTPGYWGGSSQGNSGHQGNSQNTTDSPSCADGQFMCQGSCRTGGSCPYQGNAGEYYCPAGTLPCSAGGGTAATMNTCCCLVFNQSVRLTCPR